MTKYPDPAWAGSFDALSFLVIIKSSLTDIVINMSKVKPLSLDEETAVAIATAVYVYADAAYPPSGSECAQASNQSLKQLAEAIHNSPQIPFSYKKRQRPMLKAALRWFYSDENPLEHDAAIQAETLLEKLLE
ncbi:MAG: hypothetical protein HKP55_05160 [Gammaproteobacteria bacterium]|nr:hypothetical protein [Gammaproteobacteria bacterium]